MKNTIIAGGLVALAACLVSGCGSGSAAAPPAAQSAPPPATTVPAESTPSESTPSDPTPADPTPSASASSAGGVNLKSMMLTGKELGSSWTGGAGTDSAALSPTDCPEKQISAVPVDSRWAMSFAPKGKQVPIVTVRLVALASPDTSALKTAYAADVKSCKNVKATQLTMTDSAEGPKSIKGADEVVSTYVRRYTAGSNQPVFTRQVIVTRKGNVVSRVEYGNVVDAKDPQGKDFGPATAIAEKQLAKITTSS